MLAAPMYFETSVPAFLDSELLPASVKTWDQPRSITDHKFWQWMQRRGRASKPSQPALLHGGLNPLVANNQLFGEQ